MTEHTSDREIVIQRILGAPRETVWRAWTDPRHVVEWWGPTGFTTTSREMEVRTGGHWRFIMHGPDGRDYLNRIDFEEVVEPERLVYRHADDGSESQPIRFRVTVTFEATDGGTRLTLHMVFPSREEKERVVQTYDAFEGGLQHIARLAGHVEGGADGALTVALPSAREIVLRRVLAAPRDLVFQSISRPEHVRRWWGPRTLTNTVCEMDFRPGGSWRIVQRDADGREHPFRGEYLEIDPPKRIVQTFVYDVEGARDQVATETLQLEEKDGSTYLTTTISHLSTEARDLQLDSGMERGAAESFDRLAELLDTLSAA